MKNLQCLTPFLFLILSCSISASPLTMNDIVGTWSNDGAVSSCSTTVLFTLNQVFFFVESGGLLSACPSSYIGTYLIDDDLFVVRIAQPDYLDIPSKLYEYEIVGGVLTMRNALGGSDIVLERVDGRVIDGIWDGFVKKGSNTYVGRMFVEKEMFWFSYAGGRIYGRFVDYEEVGSEGSFDVKLFQSNTMFNGVSSGSFVDDSANGNAFKFTFPPPILTTNPSVTFGTLRSADGLTGQYMYEKDFCHYHLELTNGYYREVVSGNTNCEEKRAIIIGKYDDNEDGTVSLDLWDSSTGTVVKTVDYSFSGVNFTLDGVVYQEADQQHRNLTRTTIPLNAGLLSGLINALLELTSSIVSLLGLNLGLDDYDVLAVSLFKRSFSEADVVFHEPYNYEDNEQVGSSSTDAIVLPTSSSSSSLSSGSSGSSSSSTPDSSTDASSSSSGLSSSSTPDSSTNESHQTKSELSSSMQSSSGTSTTRSSQTRSSSDGESESSLGTTNDDLIDESSFPVQDKFPLLWMILIASGVMVVLIIPITLLSMRFCTETKPDEDPIADIQRVVTARGERNMEDELANMMYL